MSIITLTVPIQTIFSTAVNGQVDLKNNTLIVRAGEVLSLNGAVGDTLTVRYIEENDV